MSSKFLSKKGVASTHYDHTDLSKLSALNVSWFYNWLIDYKADSSKLGDLEYVPMIWSAEHVTRENINFLKNGKASGKFKNLLTFNEPELAEQADMSIKECLDYWPQLMSTGLRLSSPAPITTDNGWLDSFMAEANNRSCRVDFISLHFYPDFTDPDSIYDVKRKITAVYNNYKKPIWITEIGTGDINAWGIKTHEPVTQEAADSYMKSIISMFDSLDFIERYSWFVDKLPEDPIAKYSSLYTSNDELTNLGKLYQALSD